jgi:hypothetical protein
MSLNYGGGISPEERAESNDININLHLTKLSKKHI